MATDDSSRIRNVCVIGQGGAGKTSLADALVFAAGAANRIGRVDDDTSLFDTEPEEHRRKSSITASLHHVAWKKTEITLIDTPGYSPFLHDTRNCLQAASGAVLVMGPMGGEVKVETEKLWGWCQEQGLPLVAFVTRMDKERATLDHGVDDLKAIGAKPAVLQVPIGEAGAFTGVVDVLTNKAYVYQGDTGTMKEAPVPADLADEVALAREALVEAIAEGNDALLEKYLEGVELSPEELRAGLHDAARGGRIVPVLCGVGPKGIGTHALLDAIVDLLPSPVELPAWIGTDPRSGETRERAAQTDAPFSAFVFKTIVDPFAGKLSVLRIVSGKASGELNLVNTAHDSRERLGHLLKLEGKKQTQVPTAVAGDIVAVAKLKETASGDTLCDDKHPILFPMLPDAPAAISFALEARNKADDDKVVQGLHRLMEEDTALRVFRDEQTKEFVISGTGQLHIETAVERLKRKFNAEVLLKAPKVPYKETIRGHAKAQGKHKKQTGGHGQFGDCWLEMSPLPRGAGFEFEDGIVGGVIPRQFIPAVEKGCREMLDRGPLAGYPVVDVKVKLYFGSYHDVDSSEMSFKMAAHLAFKACFEQCRPILLEPIMNITVTVPSDHIGDVIGDLNSRRGKVAATDTKANGAAVVKAHVPMADVLRYAPDLRSLTQGRGDFELEFSHYEELPAHLAERVVKDAQAARAAHHG